MFMNEFGLKVMELLEERIDEEYTIFKNSIVKANDIMRNAISVQKRGENIVKNIYLEQYYEKYKKGSNIEDLVEDILREAVENREFIDDEYAMGILNNISNYEMVKDKIIIKLLNKEMNKKYLEDKIYKEYLDLAIVFQIVVSEADKDMAISSIHKEIFKKWDVSVDEVYEQALENTQRMLPENIIPLDDVILGIINDIGKKPSDFEIEDDFDNRVSLFYVLSNNFRCNGAATMLYKDILKDFASKFDVEEVMIIPSSVEEVLFIPKRAELDLTESRFRQMLLEVNETIEGEIVLSENIYVYNLNDDEIRIYND